MPCLIAIEGHSQVLPVSTRGSWDSSQVYQQLIAAVQEVSRYKAAQQWEVVPRTGPFCQLCLTSPPPATSGEGIDLEGGEGGSDHILVSYVGPTALLDMLGRWEPLQALRVPQDGSPRLRRPMAAAERRHQVLPALPFRAFGPPSGGRNTHSRPFPPGKRRTASSVTTSCRTGSAPSRRSVGPMPPPS